MAQISTTTTSTTRYPSKDKRLKAYIRYGADGRVVSGPIFRRWSPKEKGWVEIEVNQCCQFTTTTTTTLNLR